MAYLPGRAVRPSVPRGYPRECLFSHAAPSLQGAACLTPPGSPLRAGRGGRPHHTGSHLCCIERVAVDTSRQGPRVLTVLDEHGAVHDGVGNALRPLADTPAIVGKVVH